MNLSEYILEINNHFSSILRMISSNNNVTLEQGKLLLCIPYDGISMTDLSKELGIDLKYSGLHGIKAIILQNDVNIMNKLAVFIRNCWEKRTSLSASAPLGCRRCLIHSFFL